MKIYVASSWRNEQQPAVVKRLMAEGHEVYDFRNPGPCARCEGRGLVELQPTHSSTCPDCNGSGRTDGFGWRQLDPNWESWSPEKFREMLDHPIAEAGFDLDFDAMQEADACVLVMPCGRSAHLEAGWFIGQNKPTFILLADGEPELMYKMAGWLCIDLDETVLQIAAWQAGA